VVVLLECVSCCRGVYVVGAVCGLLLWCVYFLCGVCGGWCVGCVVGFVCVLVGGVGCVFCVGVCVDVCVGCVF
jgi:hypothetical protein